MLKMNSQAWNHDNVVFDVDQPGLYLVSYLDQHTTGNTQRTVKPRVIKHAAICLGIQAKRVALTGKLWLSFYLVGWRIAVGNGKLEMVRSISV